MNQRNKQCKHKWESRLTTESDDLSRHPNIVSYDVCYKCKTVANINESDPIDPDVLIAALISSGVGSDKFKVGNRTFYHVQDDILYK